MPSSLCCDALVVWSIWAGSEGLSIVPCTWMFGIKVGRCGGFGGAIHGWRVLVVIEHEDVCFIFSFSCLMLMLRSSSSNNSCVFQLLDPSKHSWVVKKSSRFSHACTVYTCFHHASAHFDT